MRACAESLRTRDHQRTQNPQLFHRAFQRRTLSDKRTDGDRGAAAFDRLRLLIDRYRPGVAFACANLEDAVEAQSALANVDIVVCAVGIPYQNRLKRTLITASIKSKVPSKNR